MQPISERLRIQNTEKPKDLRNAKYDIMAKDAFAFYRGTCGIFYEDLYRAVKGGLSASPLVWASGDLHMANFGTYRGATDLIYFDINDFDEAALAPTLWELSRLAASIIVWWNCRNGDRVSTANARAAASHCLETYAATITAGNAGYIASQLAEGGKVDELLKKAANEKMKELLEKETNGEKGQCRFKIPGEEEDKREVTNDDEKKALLRHVETWAGVKSELNLNEYKVLDVVFRIAGTGSVGLNRYMFLLHRQHEGQDKYLMMEMKEASESSIPPFLGEGVKQPFWASEAHRIVQVQQRMQAVSPPILATTFFDKKHYIVQQKQPEKKKVKLDELKLDNAYQVIGCMARVTAYAQLRSADREGSANVDALIAFGKNGAWREAVLKYAQAYADLMMNYYADFKGDLATLKAL